MQLIKSHASVLTSVLKGCLGLFSSLLFVLVFNAPLAFAKKDCSHVKSMAELQQCDPAQYAETQAMLVQIKSSLVESERTLAEGERVLQQHTETMKGVNEDLRQTIENAKNRPH